VRLLVLLATIVAAHGEGSVRTPVPQPPQEQRALEVRVAGVVKAKLTAGDIEKMTPLPQSQGVGGKARVYSLRDAVAAIAGPNAQLVAVELTGGKRVVVADKDWLDPERTPILWQNRRGLFKAGWIDKTGKPLPDAPEWRDVAALEIKMTAAPIR
jgi:hypothetical protein